MCYTYSEVEARNGGHAYEDGEKSKVLISGVVCHCAWIAVWPICPPGQAQASRFAKSPDLPSHQCVTLKESLGSL